ncbi:MAG: DUF362 domain-containing protein [Firmicutes bacterium]|jgi:uncharacterized protein (DUF362 family)|nr:DUF362 domain-containing protein [Bacillota bacterium]HOB21946.1 DUF362 domain-containing protein [Bacillota bacterium]HQD40530.1 DUF362 domain-containing protein [Bacillota bacterium]
MLRGRRDNRSIVTITQNADEGKAIREALALLEFGDKIKRTDTVVIVPNWVKKAPPESGTVVGPESLRQLIRWLRGHDPKRIVVACGSGSEETPQIMEQVGYKAVIEQEQVEFVDLNYGPYMEIQLEAPPPLDRIQVNCLLQSADIMISYSQIKVHEEATVTLGIKNIALSWPPAEIHGFPKKKLGIHDQLHEFITAMAKQLPIDLAILSTDKAMVGRGPSGGKAVDADLIVAGTDPVAADVIGARLLGFQPQAVRYLFNLIRAGVGQGELQNIELRGIPLHQAELHFSRAAYNAPVAVD